MTDAKPATEYANRICDDDALYLELHELLRRTSASDARRLKDVLDEATLQNIVCAITEGSDAIQKRIDTERVARLAAEARVKVLEGALREASMLAEAAPELNMGNYNDDDVHGLNNAMIEICLGLRAALKEQANG